VMISKTTASIVPNPKRVVSVRGKASKMFVGAPGMVGGGT